MRTATFLLLLTCACYTPSYQDCALTCTATSGCPGGLTCDAHGWCRPSADLPECAAGPIPDGSPELADADPQAPDAPNASDGGVPVDAAAPCTCDPVQQSCCDDGDACDLRPPLYPPVCREVTLAGTQGMACVDATQCAQAHTCSDDPSPGPDGTCKQFCDTDDLCAGGAGSLCESRVGLTLQRVCTTSCDPVDAAGCASEFTCVIAYEGSGGGRVWTDCRAKGNGKQGDPCTDHDDCKRGHFCRGGDGPSRCAEYCEKQGASTCPGGTSCQQLDGNNVYIGAVEYGYCD